MNLRDVMLDDLCELFFDTEDGAVLVSFVTAGVGNVPARIEYGADPLIQEPNAATRATLRYPCVYKVSGVITPTPTIAAGDVVRFGGHDWLADPPASQGGDVTTVPVRRKEGVVR